MFAIPICHPNSHSLYGLAVFQENNNKKHRNNYRYHILLHSEKGSKEFENILDFTLLGTYLFKKKDRQLCPQNNEDGREHSNKIEK